MQPMSMSEDDAAMFAELAAIEEAVHPDLYEQDIDMMAEQYEEGRITTIVDGPIDNPWK